MEVDGDVSSERLTGFGLPLCLYHSKVARLWTLREEWGSAEARSQR